MLLVPLDTAVLPALSPLSLVNPVPWQQLGQARAPHALKAATRKRGRETIAINALLVSTRTPPARQSAKCAKRAPYQMLTPTSVNHAEQANIVAMWINAANVRPVLSHELVRTLARLATGAMWPVSRA